MMLLSREERFVWGSGGAGSGKTVLQAAVALCHLMIPNAKIVLVGNIYHHLLAEAERIVEGFRKLFGPLASSVAKISYRDNKNNAEFSIKTIWGSTIKGVSVSDGAGQAMLGFGADIVILCEGDQISHDVYVEKIWRAVSRTPTIKRGGVFIPRGRILGLSTANAAGGTLTAEVEKILSETKGDACAYNLPNVSWERSVFIESIPASSNPDYDMDKYDADIETLRRYHPEVAARNYEGKIVRSQNLVFNQYVPAIHNKSMPTPDHVRSMRLCVGMDEGTSFATVITGIDKNCDYWILGSFFCYNWTIEDKAKGVHELLTNVLGPLFPEQTNKRMLPTIIDSWMIDRSCRDKPTYEQHLGISLDYCDLGLTESVDLMNSLFQKNKLHVVEDECGDWIRAANKYVYRGTNASRTNKDRVINGAHSHLPDASRYAIIGCLMEEGPLTAASKALTEQEAYNMEVRNRLDWRRSVQVVRPSYYGDN